MGNITGKSYALTAVTPMKPWKTPILRFLFWFVGTWPGQLNDLINLSFIHFARWVIVKRSQWPRLTGSQPAEELNYDYLLFFSNFNGTWNQYIDAFAQAIPHKLNLVWLWSEKFPGAMPVTAFKRYITRVQIEADYYYTSYPFATTNDVKAAHRVHAAFESFRQQAPQIPPEQFDRAWLAFLAAVQRDLGKMGPAPVGT